MPTTNQPIKPRRLHHLLGRLLDIYSPSGKEEEVVDYLHAYLKRHGLPVQRLEVDENRHNLIVRPNDVEPVVVFIGHVDTVTAFDLDEIDSHEENGRIFGIGAADMKGGCAAMIEAFICLRENNELGAPAALALVVGEEEEGDGAAALVREMPTEWAVIGEPTGLNPGFSHYGYIELQLKTQGRLMHASLARRGRTAVETLLHLLLELTRHLERRHPELVYNIRDLFTSGSGFVVPNACESWLDLHLPPTADPKQIVEELKGLLNGKSSEYSDLTIEMQFHTIQPGYALEERGLLAEALKSVYVERGLKWETQSFPSHSDANQLWAAGVKPVILGPGRLANAHRPDESVSFDRVRTAAEIYFQTAVRLAG